MFLVIWLFSSQCTHWLPGRVRFSGAVAFALRERDHAPHVDDVSQLIVNDIQYPIQTI